MCFEWCEYRIFCVILFAPRHRRGYCWSSGLLFEEHGRVAQSGLDQLRAVLFDEQEMYAGVDGA